MAKAKDIKKVVIGDKKSTIYLKSGKTESAKTTDGFRANIDALIMNGKLNLTQIEFDSEKSKGKGWHEPPGRQAYPKRVLLHSELHDTGNGSHAEAVIMASKFLKTILVALLAITILLIPTIVAQALGEPAPSETTSIVKQVTIPTPTATPSTTDVIVPKIPPGHFLYSAKLTLEDLQELLTFDAVKKARFKQEHLKNRIDELKYEVYLNGNKNTAKLLQKIQEKRLETEEYIENHDLKCAEGSDSSCADKVKKILESHTRKNIEILNNLLNNPSMPNASKKGLQNAVNKSGMKQLKANMAQGNYRVSSSVMSMLPFRTANLYEPTEKTWYSAIINRDSVTISTNKLIQPDVTLYPTKAQMSEFTSIAKSINKNGLTWKDVGRITKLWYNIKKEVN